MTPEQEEQWAQAHQAYREGRISKKMLKKVKKLILLKRPLPPFLAPVVVPEEDPWDEMLALIPSDPPPILNEMRTTSSILITDYIRRYYPGFASRV
jgi:hypothetical protein